MQFDTTFIKNERYTHSQVSVRIHFNWQKKRRSTEDKLKWSTRMKAKRAWD